MGGAEGDINICLGLNRMNGIFPIGMASSKRKIVLIMFIDSMSGDERKMGHVDCECERG